MERSKERKRIMREHEKTWDKKTAREKKERKIIMRA